MSGTFDDLEIITSIVIDCAYAIHSDVGPGLLESAYEAFLAHILGERGFAVERQKALPLCYRGVNLDAGFRVDLLVNQILIIEIKSVERLLPVHGKQVLTYLRMSGLPIGLLINFGAEHLKDGIKRVIDNRSDYQSSWPRKR